MDDDLCCGAPVACTKPGEECVVRSMHHAERALYKPLADNAKPSDMAVYDGIAANYSALAVQIGGGHYKGMAIQPVEYIHRNGLGYCEGAVVKYVSRWRAKGGVEDLKKARHFIDLLIEMEAKTP